MKLKKFIILLITLVVLLTACNQTRTPDKAIIAEVNGIELTLSEYNKNLILFGNQYESVFGKDVWNQEIKEGVTYKESFNQEMFERMVIQELIFQESERLGLFIEEADVESELNRFKEKNIDSQLFTTNDESISIDDEFLKKQFRYELIVVQMKEKLMNDEKITYNIVEEYYNSNKELFTETEIRASHILFKTIDDEFASIQEAEIESKYALAETVLNKIINGNSFESMAVEYSEDELTAAIGGDLGYFKDGEMADEFNQAVKNLNVGEVSNVVQTLYGYHIIKVYDKIEEVAQLSDVYDGIVLKLQNDLFDEEISNLYSNAKIVEHKNVIDSIGD